MKKIIAVLFLCMAIAGCTDAERSRLGSYGAAATVTCYSGGNVIYKEISTGKVMALEGGDVEFRSSTTGKYVRTFADCIVEEN